jgi:hypothetical protein
MLTSTTIIGEGAVSRSGRKRKAGKRHPGGELVRDKRPDDRVRASRQPHRRMLKEGDRLSEKAESLLGRLSLQIDPESDKKKPTSLISAEQFEAGELYARTVGKYRSTIESPPSGGGFGRELPSGNAEPADPAEKTDLHIRCGSDGADPIERQVRLGGVVLTLRQWPCGNIDDGCSCAQHKARYDGAFEAVMRAGQRAARAVARVAVHGEAIAPQDLVYLKAGLDALARHYGVDGSRRGEYSGNRH